MVWSDTTLQTGLVQRAEKWTGLGKGGISNSTTRLQQFAADFNEAFDELMPYALALADNVRFDDTNNSDFPSGTLSLDSTFNNYTVMQDDNSLSILNILRVFILPSSSSTTYAELEKVTADDARVPLMLSPNAAMTGIPTAVFIQGNTIFFDKIPNYTNAAGIKIFFEREQIRFTATGNDTRTPGIPTMFHPVLGWIASHAWLSVYKPNSTAITRLEKKIADAKVQFETMISQRVRGKTRMKPNVEDTH